MNNDEKNYQQPPEGDYEDIEQQDDQSILGWRPVPPFDWGEDQDFSFEITRFLREPTTGFNVWYVFPVHPEYALNEHARNPLFGLPQQIIASLIRRVQELGSLPGAVLEQRDPIIKQYTPPLLPISGRTQSTTAYSGTSGNPTLQTRIHPSRQTLIAGEPQGITTGDRWFLEGRTPELLYSSIYQFKLVVAYILHPRSIGGFFPRLFVTNTRLNVIGAPVWSMIELKQFGEGEKIDIDVKPYVKNEVDTWAVSSPAQGPQLRLDIPNFPLSISTDGIISSTNVVPNSLQENLNYSYTATARNDLNAMSPQLQVGQFQIIEDAPRFQNVQADFEMDESADDFSFLVGNIAQYIEDFPNDPPDRYTIRVFGRHPPDAPNLTVRVDNRGNVIVEGPMLVDVDALYWVEVTAYNEGGQGKFVFNIRIVAEIPAWGPLNDATVVEGNPIRIEFGPADILNFSEAHTASAPIQYRVNTNRRGFIHLQTMRLPNGGVRVTGTAPTVKKNEAVLVTMGATNIAAQGVWGERDFTLTIEDEQDEIDPVVVIRPEWDVDRIPDQSMNEGDVFNIDLSGYVRGDPSAWELTGISASNRDAPNISIAGPNRLDIHSDGPNEGTIYGVGTLGYTAEEAEMGIFYPNVKKDEPYTISVRITGDQETELDAIRAFVLTINQLPPQWGNIPSLEEDELEEFSHDVSQYVKHEPDEYQVVATPSNPSSLDPPPPALTFAVTNAGMISHDELPEVARDEPYSVAVTGTNNAGSDTGFFIFTINQTPPVWLPIPAQSGEEEDGFLMNLSTFADREPDTFSVISTVKSRTEAPNLSFTASARSGLIRKTLPKVSQNENYTVTVRCSNTAGNAVPDASFQFTILNTLPEWNNIPTIIMNESTSRTVSLYSYMDDIDGVTFSSGMPVLTAYTGMDSPTLDATTTSGGSCTLTASDVEATAYWDVPITATNDVGSASETLRVQVLDTTQAPVFTRCNDQEVNEFQDLDFDVLARSNLPITYSRVSGPSWVTIDASTGDVSGTAPEVVGEISANPSDVYPVTFRASVTNSAVTPPVTETTDCTLNITVFNVQVPVVNTPVSWATDIADRAFLERADFSFNIARHATGNPTPTFGERTGAGTPDFVSISSTGRVSGQGPQVGNVATVATIDGRVWRMVLSADRSVTSTQLTISGLPSGVTLQHTVAGLNTRTYYLVFSAAVPMLLRTQVSISGAPSVTIREVSQSWWAAYTVYVTAFNITDGTLNSANQDFEMLFINTDAGPITRPTLDVDDQIVNEDEDWELDLKDFTTGDLPITYRQTFRDEENDTGGVIPLPNWSQGEFDGTGVNLTSDGILSGHTPRIPADLDQTISVTAVNAGGTSSDEFTVTIEDVPVGPPHEAPEWNIKDKRVVEGDTLTIDPLDDDEVKGTLPITITVTPEDPQGNDYELPSWLALSNNVISGRAPQVDAGAPPLPIYLTATNTDSDGVEHSEDVAFTVTVIDNPTTPPDWDIDNITVDEGDEVTIDPITNGELDGARPLTITVTPNSVQAPVPPQTTNLPSWLTQTGNVFKGTAPDVPSPRRVDTVRLTATNMDGATVRTDRTSFTITINHVDEPVIPHNPPVWSLGNQDVTGGAEVELEPIEDGTLRGDMPITISVLPNSVTTPTQPSPTPSPVVQQTTNLPNWLTLSSNRITGTAPANLMAETTYTMRLRATNTDSAGTAHTADVTVEFKVSARTTPPCTPVTIRGIRQHRIVVPGSGVIDIRDRIRGTNPVVSDNPAFSSNSFVLNPENHGAGLIQWRVPNDFDTWFNLTNNGTVGYHQQYIRAINECTNEYQYADFTIEVVPEVRTPPVCGDIPPMSVDAGSSLSFNLSQYLTSTHGVNDRVSWKKAGGIDPESQPWQYVDWWTVDAQGNVSIMPPTGAVSSNTTRTISFTATNVFGEDTCHKQLTVIYIPQPPECEDNLPMEVVKSRAIIGVGENVVDMLPNVDNHVTNWEIDTVRRVTVGAPELFLKFGERHLSSRIFGSTNASDSGATGTSPLLSPGQDATVDTTSAPDVQSNTDYEVVFTATNVSLVTTPRFPRNSTQCRFILRVAPVSEPPPPPSCLQIPLQVSNSGESISMGLGGFFINCVRYSIETTIHVSGENPGAIVLEANTAGVVTRQGGAVAPTVMTTAEYSVTMRGYNSINEFVDCTFRWWIIPPEPPPGTTTSFIADRTNLYEWDHNNAVVTRTTAWSAGAPATVAIEGVSNTLYYFLSNGELGTIAYDGETAVRTRTHTVTATGVRTWSGLTSVGRLLYSIGNDIASVSGGHRLYSIDPTTGSATAVNTAPGALNFGVSNVNRLTVTTGLASSGTDIYIICATSASSSGDLQLIRIPTTGGNSVRGIGVVVDGDIFDGFITRANQFVRPNTQQAVVYASQDVEIFGSNIQISIIYSATLYRSTFNLSLSGTPSEVRTRRYSTTGIATPEWQGITQYALRKPTFNRVPTQLVQEGQVINFPLASYVSNATGFRIGTLTAATAGAPLFPLEISLGGTIRGTAGNLTAPLVVGDSYYRLPVTVSNNAGGVTQTITIGVLNAPPIWGAIPPQFVREGQRIRISLSPFVQNVPTSFRVGTITKPRDLAPNLSLQMDAQGNLFGVGDTVNAPLVDMDERYIVQVFARNTAGERSTTFDLTVEDIGALSEQTPYVRRWDTPERAQGGAFDVLMDFNIPVYGVTPESFDVEGVDLRGRPTLLWSPVPAQDIEENRPDADARNLDYLTEPVPISGTKYYKLSFPRDILPETITRDQLMNIYLTSNSVRGGVTS